MSKSFPTEEKYNLTNQIRSCSRSVFANFGEVYRIIKYPAHFVNKPTVCDAEGKETEIWLKFFFDCKYINKKNI